MRCQSRRAMSFRSRAMLLYFDKLYNRVYDLTTACLSPYHRLQQNCIARLDLADNDEVLCVGVGTGNEIEAILERKARVSLTGIDISPQALGRAQRKATRKGKAISLHRMDAHRLDFAPGSFDKAICIHLMDFLADGRTASAEIVRVLKSQGRFAITYPYGRDSFRMAAEIASNAWRNLKAGRPLLALKELLGALGVALVFLPVGWWASPGPGLYSRQQLEEMFAALGVSQATIEEDGIYKDYIVHGRK